MKHQSKQMSISGTVTAVFARRFVVEDQHGKHLADIGKAAVELVALREGDAVTLTGRLKSSEIKVAEIARGPGETIKIERKGKLDLKNHHNKHPPRHDPRDAIAAIALEGFSVVGEPLGKPKHFEILGRSAKGKFVEFHVGPDGAIDKRKPADIRDAKWAPAISAV